MFKQYIVLFCNLMVILKEEFVNSVVQVNHV